ncbi:MAG: aldehyde dehydrogenase family protein [Eubacteriales bacterium]|nr:aldehyde dehydrogenase family protein [Eubacteriales bacterium]
MYTLIGGERIEKGCGTIDVINPVTGEVIDTVPALTKELLDVAVTTAAEGQKEWAAYTQMERNRILRKFAQIVQERREELGKLLCQENGKRISEAEEEFDTVVALIDSYCDKASHMYGVSLPNGTDATSCHTDVIFTRYEPLGVVACLLPFNFPVELCGHKIAPALAVGNAVVIKPPTDCPLAVIKLAECLHEAGVPKKAVQVVTGRGSVIGDLLVEHPGIAAITMTGGTETGIRIANKTAGNLTRTYLELGGNDAFVIMDDADIDLTIGQALESRTNNAGQVCCASKRYIVHEDVAEEFTEKLIAALKIMKIGDPMDRSMDIGSMISEKARNEVIEQIKHTVDQGARLVYGGEAQGKSFLIPAVLTGVTGDMDIAKDMEIFGVVFPIITFKTVQEAIALVNNCPFGLNSAVFSRNIALAISIGEKIQAGSTIINGGGNYRTAAMPFGGYKKSGIGREGSAHTLEEFVQEKSYVLKAVLGNV